MQNESLEDLNELFQEAMIENNIERAKEILKLVDENKAEGEFDINEEDEEGRTALQFFLDKEEIDVGLIKLLIEKKAQVGLENEAENVFFLAYKNGNELLMDLFLQEYHKNKTERGLDHCLRGYSSNKRINLEGIKKLIDLKANPNPFDQLDGSLHLASLNDNTNLEIIKYLVEVNRRIN